MKKEKYELEVNLESNKRGRPVGFKVSDMTKERIRIKRLGTFHSQDTKDKISRSLFNHFKNKDKLSNSLLEDYKYSSTEASEWISSNRKDIDVSDKILTSKRMTYVSKMEICVGGDIEFLFHESTPESILVLKEELIELGMIEEARELASLV